MSLAPLYIAYRSDSGATYVYDVNTDEIVRVGETIAAVVGDFGILDADELLEKHRGLGAAQVKEALAQLTSLQSRGILRAHFPRTVAKPERICSQGVNQGLEDFLATHRRSLTLELTQQCNLRCTYCTYGDSYPDSRFRAHGEGTMSLDIARKAILAFLAHHPAVCDIGFYGGEPLLEFELLTKIVTFATEQSRRIGIPTRFSITTNGTLLEDQVIHFLAAHQFIVLVSLDGPRHVHDRCRTFRSMGNGQARCGSFDAVMRNLERFRELYPKHLSLNVAVTVSAWANFEEVNAFFAALSDSYPTPSISIVRRTPFAWKKVRHGAAIGAGTCGAACLVETATYTAGGTASADRRNCETSGGTSVARECEDVPDFDDWTGGREERYAAFQRRFIEEMCRRPDAKVIRRQFPLLVDGFTAELSRLHCRAVSAGDPRVIFRAKCFPGSVRTFCSTDGRHFPCERMDSSELGRLSGQQEDVDVHLAIRLMELLRLLGDCGNCSARTLCSICPAQIPEANEVGAADSCRFQRRCSRRLISAEESLQEYTSIMENSPHVMDALMSPSAKDGDWLNDITVLPTDDQLRDGALHIEEIDERTCS